MSKSSEGQRARVWRSGGSNTHQWLNFSCWPRYASNHFVPAQPYLQSKSRSFLKIDLIRTSTEPYNCESLSMNSMIMEEPFNRHQGKASGDYLEAFEGNIEDIHDYMRREFGDDHPHAAFGTQQLQELFDSINTDEFWDDIFGATTPQHSLFQVYDEMEAQPSAVDDLKLAAEHEAEELVAKMKSLAVHNESVHEIAKSSEEFKESFISTIAKKAESIDDLPLGRVVVEQELEVDAFNAFMRNSAFWDEAVRMYEETKKTERSEPIAQIKEQEAVEEVKAEVETKNVSDTLISEVVEAENEEIKLETIGVEKKINHTVKELIEEVEEIKYELEGKQPSEPPLSPKQLDYPSKSFFPDSEPEKSPTLPTSSLWQDLDVVAGHPAKQVELNKVTQSEQPILSILAEEINFRAHKGPDLIFSFTILVIAAASVALIAYSHSVQESPILFRVLWILAFCINVITVSIPGRLDRVLVNGHHVKPWSSLFEASTWAFSLWGVIYLSETLLSGYVGLIGIPIKLFQKIVAYWLAGNWAQGLWCFAFRPEFKEHLYAPTVLLSLGMFSFWMAHVEITAFLQSWSTTMVFSKAVMYIFRVPFALHSGWLAAAALLNLNSYVAIKGCSKGTQLAVAHMSAYIAAMLGIYGAVSSCDPLISLTVAWAMEAVAARSREKMHLPRNLIGADAYESLALTEQMVANGMKCLSLGLMVAPFVK